MFARVVIMPRANSVYPNANPQSKWGTTPSVISHIESGQHRTNTKTIRRLVQALGGQAVLGFDFGTPGKPKRELVTHQPEGRSAARCSPLAPAKVLNSSPHANTASTTFASSLSCDTGRPKRGPALT